MSHLGVFPASPRTEREAEGQVLARGKSDGDPLKCCIRALRRHKQSSMTRSCSTKSGFFFFLLFLFFLLLLCISVLSQIHFASLNEGMSYFKKKVSRTFISPSLGAYLLLTKNKSYAVQGLKKKITMQVS